MSQILVSIHVVFLFVFEFYIYGCALFKAISENFPFFPRRHLGCPHCAPACTNTILFRCSYEVMLGEANPLNDNLTISIIITLITTSTRVVPKRHSVGVNSWLNMLRDNATRRYLCSMKIAPVMVARMVFIVLCGNDMMKNREWCGEQPLGACIYSDRILKCVVLKATFVMAMGLDVI